MHDFDNFLNIGCSEAASIMGEPIKINGQVLNAVFDEQISDWEMNEYGDSDNPELKLVVAILDLNKLPNKKDRFTRMATGETFFITQISTSTGNVEIQARNETKLNAK
tara:strand:- start:82 stop:405 length:324 start_codon:yes stop_codon:yes gene_type:complete